MAKSRTIATPLRGTLLVASVLQAILSAPRDGKVPERANLWRLRNSKVSAIISELVNADLVRDNLPVATFETA